MGRYILVRNIIISLKLLASEYPDQDIVFETKNGSITNKLHDATIYKGMRGEIVIDCE